MKRISARMLKVWAMCLGLGLGSVIAFALALGASISSEHRLAALALLDSAGPLPYLLALLLAIVAGFLASWLVGTYFSPLIRAAEGTMLCATANPRYRVEAAGPEELKRLTAAVNTLADRHEAALHDVETRVRQARADLETERNRLAVLMSELAQSVVVCNAEGLIVLYNEQARRLFSGPARGSVESAVGFMGLGRSLYTLIAREPVQHAIERLNARTAAGELDPIAVFTTTLPNGILVRVRIAPMAGTAEGPSGQPAPSGFVLLLEDVSQDVVGVEGRDRILIDLLERSRASLASLRAATENLAGFPDLDAARRERFLAIALEEAKRLGVAVEHAAHAHAESARLRPRALEPMRAADLAAVLRTSLVEKGVSARVDSADERTWLDVDCHAMVQAVRYLGQRMQEEFGIRDFLLAVDADQGHAYLDLVWLGHRISVATTAAWETDPLSAGGEASSNTLREILQHHGAEMWHEFDRPSGRARFRIMLPLGARETGHTAGTVPGRPFYYDFDLTASAAAPPHLDVLLLQDLTYTVFDTETTGLDPQAGDEIISIGAVRIVNGRVLREEAFEQLVDPRRRIDPQATKIHGIREVMLRGQPSIAQVLPSFQRFCGDTVLVGHNVAFDLRFLQMKEASTGVAFRQPVLDTLLLSAVLHDSIEDNRLEAIAHRLGIEVVGRHTALGDALVTADIFLKLLPLLAERGIRTLREAREASERTAYAKLRY
ncbi:MAG: DNA polymerase III subunit epsilon [Betaproteobacteria bacterium]|nr:MAG: DNA polymerase III subunit epsilon [Betaproteobacteria bacterium]